MVLNAKKVFGEQHVLAHKYEIDRYDSQIGLKSAKLGQDQLNPSKMCTHFQTEAQI